MKNHLFKLLFIIVFGAVCQFPQTSQSLYWKKQESGTVNRLNSVAASIYNPNKWYIAGDNGTFLYLETDGKTWSAINLFTSQNLNKVKFSLDNVGFVVGDSGVIFLKDYNGGEYAFNKIKDITYENLHDISFTSSDSSVIFVGDHGTILKSNTFSININLIDGSKNYDLNSVSFTQSGFGWAVGTNGTILRSTDYGDNWFPQTGNTSAELKTVKILDRNNGWAAGGNGEIIFTTDGGKNWTSVKSDNLNEINSGYFQSKMLQSESTGFNKYNDNSIYSMTSNSQGDIFFYFVGTSNYGVCNLDKDGTIKTYSGKGGETFYTDLKFNENDTLFAVRNLYAVFCVPSEGSKGSVWAILPDTKVKLTTLDIDSMQNIWTGGDNYNIYSITPSKKITAFPFKNSVNRIKINNGYLYASVNGSDSVDAIWRFKIFSSDSLGTPELFLSMSEITGIKPAKIFDFVFDSEGELIICSNMPDVIDIVHNDKSLEPLMNDYYPGLSSSVIKNAYLTFSGKSKNELNLGFATKPDPDNYITYSDIYKINIHPLADLPVWLAGNGGTILTKEKNDTAWNSQYSSTKLNLNAISFADDTTGVAVGDSGLILCSTSEVPATGIHNASTEETAISSYELFQNYPNPFNPTTSIEYVLPKTSYVKICVYNMLGEVVAELVNGNQSKGRYQIIWNAKDVASGIYFYALFVNSSEGTGGIKKIKKMILLR